MKNYLTLILTIMFFNASAQPQVYTKNIKKETVVEEETTIEFADDGVTIPAKVENQSAALIALLPTAVDMGIRFAGDLLEKREKSFTAEYDHTQSNLKIGVAKVPSFTFVRKIKTKNLAQLDSAISIKFKANTLQDFSSGMYYSVESLKVDYSKAKITENHKKLNYAVTIKMSFLVVDKEGNAEKKEIELNTINVPFVEVGKEKTNLGNKYTSDIIMLPSGGRLAEVGIKIVESNPAKVKAEKISKLFEDNKDDIKTVINNFLPKVEESKVENGGNSGGGNEDPNKSTGN